MLSFGTIYLLQNGMPFHLEIHILDGAIINNNKLWIAENKKRATTIKKDFTFPSSSNISFSPLGAFLIANFFDVALISLRFDNDSWPLNKFTLVIEITIKYIKFNRQVPVVEVHLVIRDQHV